MSTAHSPTATAPRREQIAETIRRVLADELGVRPAALAPEVSLHDDLAADSLDLAGVGIALEAALGIDVPLALLDRVRTCGELVEALVTVAAGPTEVPESVSAPLARVTISTPHGGGAITRTLRLTPYALETILADARRLGRGTYVRVLLAPRTPAEAFGHLALRFEPLADRGIVVRLRRATDRDWPGCCYD
ncbi:MAG: acyl carrier protein [bacterium]|nr:acyl carrier protein [bacterium]